MSARAAERGRAWLELARVSNAPTVVSNALAGAALGMNVTGADVPPTRIAAVAAGLVMIYIAGMILNDAADAAVDRIERPARAIPSGRVSRVAAALVGFVLLLLGTACAAWAAEHARWAAAALAGAVAVYTLIHQRTSLGILVMGACRGLAYVVAISVAADPLANPWLLAPASGVALYTVALSVVARIEMSRRRTGRWARWLPLAWGIGAMVTAGVPNPGSLAAGAALVAVHIAAALGLDREGPAPKRRAVQLWISAFCLVDAGVAAAVGRLDLAGACVACFAVTVWGQRSIVGT